MLKMICLLFILNLSAPINKAYILKQDYLYPLKLAWILFSQSFVCLYASLWSLKALAQYGTINLSILLWQKDRKLW